MLGVVSPRWPGLTVSFLVPAALTLMPIVSPMRGIALALQIGGALAFYSYVLLPTALKFDFRRNIDRLMTFKRMPLSGWTVTLGQLATPVLAMTAFQAIVFGIAVGLSSVTVSEAAVGLLLLTPTNVLVLAIENLIFLLYPYRISQEGIEIFLRSVLMFTGKGLMMLAALGAVLGWSFICRFICAGSSAQPVVFLVGLVSATAVLALGAMWLLTRAYEKS